MAMISLRPLSFFCLLFILISQTTAQPSFLDNFCMNEKEIDYGFYNFSYGQSPDKVYPIGLCRGDVKPDDCRTCLNDSRVLLPQCCPNQKEAIGWYDHCMLRYSHRSIFNTMESEPDFYLPGDENATNVDQFIQARNNLINNLTSKASSGDSRRKFALRNAAGLNIQTIYGLVQCTPDLSELECSECLAAAISPIPNCCNGKIRGRFFEPSCNVQYDNYPFYNATAETPPPPVSPPPPPPRPSTNKTSTDGKSNTSKTVIAVPISALVVLLIVICIYLGVRKSKKKFEEDNDEIGATESLLFDFDMITVATNDFLDANKQGQGGFGAVYHGKLYDGKEIAVKRLSINSDQGDIEFKNEVKLLAKLQHRNLVKLLGFCMERGEKLLVYEFLPNKSLDYFIFEIITGCKSNSIRHRDDVEHLVSFAWRNWRKGTAASHIVDPKLNNGSQNEIMRCIHIGLLCVQENAADRPTMATVVLMLNSYSYNLPEPSQPAFFMQRSLSNMQPGEYNSGQTGSSESKSVQESINEASITDLDAR